MKSYFHLCLIFFQCLCNTKESNFLGMDRLCASTESGRLQFYVIGPSSHHSGDADSLDLDGISCKTQSVRDDSLDNVDSTNQIGLYLLIVCCIVLTSKRYSRMSKGTYIMSV